MNALLELRSVSLRYPGPPPVTALHDCSLTVGRGDFLTVTGPSGSGKSTLLNILGLLDAPTEGEFVFDGRPTRALGESERAAIRGRSIGFVFQSFQLLDQRTCLDNVALASLYTGETERAARGAALRALDAVGLADRAESLPVELSGGQQQRVAIARAIANDPDVLLCDEPTGNLDSQTAQAILGVFERLNESGRTIVLITHDPSVAAHGRTGVRILDGAVSEAEPDVARS